MKTHPNKNIRLSGLALALSLMSVSTVCFATDSTVTKDLSSEKRQIKKLNPVRSIAIGAGVKSYLVSPSKNASTATKKIESPAAKAAPLTQSPRAQTQRAAVKHKVSTEDQAASEARAAAEHQLHSKHQLTTDHGSAVEHRPAAEQRAAALGNEDDLQPNRDYDEVFLETNARTLLMSARQHMRQHNYNRAINLLARAVKLDPDDPDVRCLYADALEEKLSHQEEKDPDLFNLCIRTLLIVVRNETGEEKGLTYKGVGLGTGYYQDEERQIKAKHSLKNLTGYLPKPWETDTHFLRRVLKPSTTSVTATIRMPQVDVKTAQGHKAKKDD